MKRFAKIMILAAAISMALASAAFAEWAKDEKGWKYLENGQPVYNQWKQDSAGDYFYLGYNGYMVTDAFVDDDRYVDATGRMVRGRWIQIKEKWHYFEATGKMVSGKKKQISGQWYYFDYDGTMVTGWYNDGTDYYYCDAEVGGHMVTNAWKKLAPSSDMNISRKMEDDNDGTYWFYFQNSGKACRASDTDFKEFSIEGVRYAFDTNGVMQTGWVKLEDREPAIAGYRYYNNDKSLGTYGAAHTGWLSAYPPEGNGDVQWYYFDNKGVPTYGSKIPSNNNAEAYAANFKKIAKNGTTYTYLFTEKGNPVYGLVQVRNGNGGFTSMYFGSKSQSCLQKATTVVEGDGTTWQYAFNAQGYGLSGPHNNYLYYKGKLQKATDDKLAFIKVDGTTYLVNASGYLVKNYNKNKQPGDVEYRSDASGIRDGGTAAVSETIEPEYQEQE